MRLNKGDMVKIITGRDKGKTGKLLKIDREKNRVLVENISKVKKHQKPNQRYRQGGIIEKEMSIHASNVMFYDESAGKATRIGCKISGKEKQRVSKKTGEMIVVKSKGKGK